MDAQAANDLDLAVEHGLGQAIFRQRVAQHAAGLGVGLEDGDLVAQQRQVEGGGQPGRAGADHRDLLAGGGQPLGDDVARHRVELVRQQDGIGDDPVNLTHVDRLVDRLAAAPVVARMLADAAGGSRQRIVHDDRFEGVGQAAFLVELQEARDVHVQRTAVLARRQGQILAHAGVAALRPDMVLELVAEMAQRGQDRVRAPTGRARTARCRGSCGPVRRVRRDPPRGPRPW